MRKTKRRMGHNAWMRFARKKAEKIKKRGYVGSAYLLNLPPHVARELVTQLFNEGWRVNTMAEMMVRGLPRAH